MAQLSGLKSLTIRYLHIWHMDWIDFESALTVVQHCKNTFVCTNNIAKSLRAEIYLIYTYVIMPLKLHLGTQRYYSLTKNHHLWDAVDKPHLLWTLLGGPGWQTHILRRPLRIIRPKLRPKEKLRVCETGVAAGGYIPVDCFVPHEVW